MRGNDSTRTGGEILIDQLAIHGVRHAFCVPVSYTHLTLPTIYSV